MNKFYVNKEKKDIILPVKVKKSLEKNILHIIILVINMNQIIIKVQQIKIFQVIIIKL